MSASSSSVTRNTADAAMMTLTTVDMAMVRKPSQNVKLRACTEEARGVLEMCRSSAVHKGARQVHHRQRTGRQLPVPALAAAPLIRSASVDPVHSMHAYLYPKAMGLRPGAAASTVARVESTARTAQAPSLTSLVKALMREPTSTPEELNSRLSEKDLVGEHCSIGYRSVSVGSARVLQRGCKVGGAARP